MTSSHPLDGGCMAIGFRLRGEYMPLADLSPTGKSAALGEKSAFLSQKRGFWLKIGHPDTPLPATLRPQILPQT